jgi:D-3-phosphoglycerate dehydrogenase
MRYGELVEREVTREQLLGMLPEIDVLMVRLAHEIDREVLMKGERLRAIVSPTTGLDHIDGVTAAEKGVTVISLQGETSFLRSIRATAEHTWALLLALLRHLPAAVDAVRRGEWDRDAFRGRELSGRTLGIVGLGRIGGMVAEFGHAFAMDVQAYDPFVNEWGGVVPVPSLEALLRGSDVVSLHVPLDNTTSGLIGRREVSWLRPHALLVNTSRAGVIDEGALVEALINRTIAGAALDGVHNERNPSLRSGNTLLAYGRSHSNLLITPHIGGATEESMSRAEVFVAEKLAAFLGRESTSPS